MTINVPFFLSLKFSRILEPLLYDLLDPSILRTPVTFKVQGRELPGFVYERPFDQRIVIHILETLLSIINFGGQGFAKAAKTAVIRRSLYNELVQRVSNSMYGPLRLSLLKDTIIRWTSGARGKLSRCPD